MRTYKYIVKEFNPSCQLTTLKKKEETFSDDGTMCKLYEEDYLHLMVNEWESDIDTLGRVVRKSDDDHTYNTKKDKRGRVVYIEHIWNNTGARNQTTISYYKNSDNIYQEITTSDNGSRYEVTYTYFDTVTQIDRVVQYGENDLDLHDFRERVLQDQYREFCTKYDLATQRVMEREFVYFSKMYSKAIYYEANGEQHTHCLREESISEYETHVCEYEDDVLTSREVTLSFDNPITKMAWLMQETTDLRTNERTFDGIKITKTII